MKHLLVVFSLLAISFVGNNHERVNRKKHSYNSFKLYVNGVVNNIKVGPLTGNPNLSLGVKNLLIESAQDRGWDIVSDRFEADQVLDVEILYFDYEQTKSNMSVFHKEDNKIIITMHGTLSDNGKVVKEFTYTDKSGEIVSTTGIIAEDGKFSSMMVRNALKKTCVVLAYKLL
jgi:hypothetical protein